MRKISQYSKKMDVLLSELIFKVFRFFDTFMFLILSFLEIVIIVIEYYLIIKPTNFKNLYLTIFHIYNFVIGNLQIHF